MSPVTSADRELNSESCCVLRKGKGFAVYSHNTHDVTGLMVCFSVAVGIRCSSSLQGWQFAS